MNLALTVVLLAVAVAVTWALTHFIGKSSYERTLASKEAELRASEQMREHEKVIASERLADARNDYERSLSELRETQKKMLDATKAELALENEKLMKDREAAVKKEAEETMKTITGGLDKDIKEMKEAFDAQKKAHTEESASIRTKFDETVQHLRVQTEAIGNQAVDLANALKGKNKMQGLFGETILENILKGEGLCQGRDYEAEFYLRDRKGDIIRNEETGKRMRPDFALHFPDNTDVLIDAKVSLTALADYFAADSDEERKAASVRNLQSVNDHIGELTGKEYQKYVQGRKTLDYVIMFIPNYGAYQLAKQEDPDIFTRAFRQNVLITTEETLVPFLRLIRSAWVQKETMDNVSEIMDGATRILDRVAIFCNENAKLEKTLSNALDDFKENSRRLTDSRQSIAKAAHDLLDAGATLSPGKTLPELVD